MPSPSSSTWASGGSGGGAGAGSGGARGAGSAAGASARAGGGAGGGVLLAWPGACDRRNGKLMPRRNHWSTGSPA
nr:MAG: hypothetical protein DIU62_11340 [Pseudomonadota bacterium]